MSFERGRLSLLESIQDVHKEDIKTYVSGHLNQSKLHKFENARHETWATSMQAPVRLKPASYPVHLPVRRGALPRKLQKQKSMEDTIKEFSLGPLGRYCGLSNRPTKCKTTPPGSTSPRVSSTSDTSQTESKNTSSIEDRSLVEEPKLPDIMFPAKDSYVRSSPTNSKSGQSGDSLKRQFVKSYFGHVTKEDQYAARKNFERTVMNLPDANDTGLLTGDRIVRKLDKRLSKKLKHLKDSSGPNFHRLQAYSDCFSSIIQQSTTFSRLLKLIKDEYDSYLAYVLDKNEVSRHEALYSQMTSLSKAKSVAEGLREQQKKLEALEDEVSQLLTENDRLREELRLEQHKPDSTPSEDVPDSALKSRIHVEEVPKDFQEQVEDLHSQIADQLETLEKMRKYQRENCVPSSVCQHFEQCIKETEVDIQKLLKQNEFLEQTIEELEHELGTLLSQSKVSEKNARELWEKIDLSDVIEYGRSEDP